MKQYGFCDRAVPCRFSRRQRLTPIHLENLYQHRPIYIASEYKDELCVICDYKTAYRYV